MRDTFERTKQQQRTMSKQVWEQITNGHPVLKKSAAHRHLFLHLSRNASPIDPRTRLRIIPYQLLERMMGREYKTTGEFLAAYHKEVDPGFTYQNYSYDDGYCRQVIRHQAEIILDTFFDIQERVYVDTMKTVNRKSKLAGAAAIKEEARKLVWRYRDAEIIAQYHLGHSCATFLDQIEPNFKAAMAEAARFYPDEIDTLLAIWDMPQPFYHPTSKSLSPRLFAEGLQGVKRELRRILCKGWVEVDLRSCQLAIIARLFHITELEDFLRSNQNIWTELLTWMNIPQEQWPVAKGIIKEAVYSVVYGKEAKKLQKELEGTLNDAGVTWHHRFIDHPLMKATLKAVKAGKEKILAEGGMMGAYGWMTLTPGYDIDRFLACVVQTYELKLIMPVYDIVLEMEKHRNNDFDIVLHQHDGVSILFHPRANRPMVFTRLKKAVDQRARELEIMTTLTME